MPETSVYRPILLRSLKTAWSHKELWPFALLAGFAGTGVIVNDVLKQARVMAAPSIDSFSTVATGAISYLTDYARTVILAGESNIILTVIGVLAVFAGLAAIVVASQQIVLVAMHRAVRKKKRMTWREILHGIHHHHFLRVFGIDALFKVVMLMAMTGSGLLLRELSLASSLDVLLAIAISALTLALGFALNIVAMFALIAVAREELDILSAIIEGVERLRRHLLVSFEVATVLFATNLLLSIGYLFGLSILATPVALLFAEALSTGAYINVLLVTIGGTLLLIGWTAACAGYATTFTYAAWTELVERMEKLPFIPRIHHYSKRLLKPTR